MSTIFLIRHAEKPDGTNDAVDETGAADKEALIVRGWQRAGALAVFFGAKDGLPAPDRIYASAPEKEKVAPKTKIGSDSERPILTVTPLAAKLGREILDRLTKGQEAALAAELAALSGVTLVCWQHEAIPEIAKAIMGPGAAIPDPWPGDRFDIVWVLERTPGGWSFSQKPQMLLAGDKSDPIA